MLERVIATLTTTFGLISSQPAMSRDLNSLLPTFFQTLLNLAGQSSLLPVVLTALHILIPEYSTTFRPSMAKTQNLVISVIEGAYPRYIQELAAKVYVDLHHSAVKGESSNHWRACFLRTITELHMVLDRLFSVVEEGTGSSVLTDGDRSKLPLAKGLGLRPIDGDYTSFFTPGLHRIETLLGVLHQFLRYLLDYHV